MFNDNVLVLFKNSVLYIFQGTMHFKSMHSYNWYLAIHFRLQITFHAILMPMESHSLSNIIQCQLLRTVVIHKGNTVGLQH